MGILKSLLSSNGKISTTRFVTIVTCLTILAVYVAHNIMAIKHHLSYVDFPSNSVMVLLVVCGAKVAQNFSEQKPVSNDKPEEAPNGSK